MNGSRRNKHEMKELPSRDHVETKVLVFVSIGHDEVVLDPRRKRAAAAGWITVASV